MLSGTATAVHVDLHTLACENFGEALVYELRPLVSVEDLVRFI